MTDLNPERALIGALLGGWRGDPDDLELTMDDFADLRLGQIFHRITGRARENKPNDPVSLLPDLTDLQLGSDRGVFLIELLQACPMVFHAEQYARQVADEADFRGLENAGRRIIQLATERIGAAEQVVENARRLLDRAPRRSDAEAQTLASILPGVIDQADKGVARGLATPWPDLDRMLHGLQGGRVYVIGARPGVGKSLLGQGLATHWACHHQLPSYVASMEMSGSELGVRILSEGAGVALTSLTDGRLSEADWQRVATHAGRLGAAPVIINDTPSQTIASIRRGARDARRRHGALGLVVIDYLQQMKATDPRVPREQQVADMSRGCKLLARELDVPVIALAQLGRGSLNRPDKRPTLADLRESGAIEADADAVMLLDRDEDSPEMNLHLAKYRSGPMGECTLLVAGHYARISSMSRIPEPVPSFYDRD